MGRVAIWLEHDRLEYELGVDCIFHSFQDDTFKNLSWHRQQVDLSLVGATTELDEVMLFPGGWYFYFFPDLTKQRAQHLYSGAYVLPCASAGKSSCPTALPFFCFIIALLISCLVGLLQLMVGSVSSGWKSRSLGGVGLFRSS